MRTSQGEIIVDTLQLRRMYEERVYDYERLIKVVNIILTTAIRNEQIKVHSLKARVKSYASFVEKVERKRYQQPFKQCTDLAGCRIICLFMSQVEQIKKIVQQEFDIIEMTDKKTSKKFDQFGYLSLHMLVKIPKNRAGFIEYGNLDKVVCEIQIRTILQEAWAEIEHYLNYKTTKEERNEELLRKIFSLAGMFEVADSTFEEIHTGFTHLVEKKEPIKTKGITALSLFKFSQQYYPWFTVDWDKKQERSFTRLSQELKEIGIPSIAALEQLLTAYHDKLERYEQYHKNKEKKAKYGSRFFSPVGLIRAAIALKYGKKFDLVFGLRGYAERVKKEISA